MKAKMEPGTCSKCGGPLADGYICNSEVCAGPRGGRYRHPVNADGDPCKCNRGHVVRNGQ